MSLPAMSRRLVRWGRLKPSYTGQMCVTPSPESTTTPVRRPKTHAHTLQLIIYNSIKLGVFVSAFYPVCALGYCVVSWVNTQNLER